MDKITFDGVTINAKHFGAMKEKEAIKRMIADGFVPGDTIDEKTAWAKEAFLLIKPPAKKEI